MVLPDRYFKFSSGGEPQEVTREEANPNFYYQTCAPGITRVSFEDDGLYTIHCDGPYGPLDLERLQTLLNSQPTGRT